MDRSLSPSDARREAEPLLTLRGITKAFPGVRALDEVDFTLRAGEIHSLLGENGAGKSTLIKVLTGVHSADSGTIQLAGQVIRPRSPAHAQTLGISTVYQEVNLVPQMTVAENLFLGRQPMGWAGISWKRLRRNAEAALARLDLNLDAGLPLNSFSTAIQQMVAIARALDVSSRILILDEPTSSLDRDEVEQLFAMMRRLKAQGMGIVFVTHFLDQVYAVSDRMTVLRNGRLVGEFEVASLPRLELVSKMIGKPLEELQQREMQRPRGEIPARGKVVLQAKGLGRGNMIEPCDLQLHEGEVLGLAGLLGSGRTELASLLFGIQRPDCGTVSIQGKPVRLKHPRQALKHRLGFVPEDRKVQGILPHLSIRENMVLSLQAARGWWRPLTRRQQEEMGRRFMESLRIAAPSLDKPVGQLSGGNQQKVILARWLASEPRILILDEPARGIDVGAKAEIEKLIEGLRQQGMAILHISGELEELVRSCSRIAVLRERRKVAELTGADIDAGTIMQWIAGERNAQND
jgi:simple sugar transport system ATP-binding protein